MPPRDTYFEKLLDEKFGRLHERFDNIERQAKERELVVQGMDAANKAENVAIKQEVMKLKSRIDKFENYVFAGWFIMLGLAAVVAYFTDLATKMGLIKTP